MKPRNWDDVPYCAQDDLDCFELNEIAQLRELRMLHNLRKRPDLIRGYRAGRLYLYKGNSIRRVHRRLSYRSGTLQHGFYMVMYCQATNETIRLPFG